MQMFDNINTFVKDDLKQEIRSGSKVSTAACFSIYAYQELKEQLSEIFELLGEAINSIINKKEESDIDSLFSAGGISTLENVVSGLNDFELICFLVIKEIN